jgi:hypothetical protein
MGDDERESPPALYPSREQVQALVKALGVLIGRTGPENEPPGFAEAIDAGEEWIGVEVFSTWVALEAVMEALPPTDIPLAVADEKFESFLWWAKIGGPVERLGDLARAVHATWQVAPLFDVETPVTFAKSDHLRRYFHLKSERSKLSFPPPVVGAADHAVFVWGHRRLVNALGIDVGAPVPESGDGPRHSNDDPSLEPILCSQNEVASAMANGQKKARSGRLKDLQDKDVLRFTEVIQIAGKSSGEKTQGGNRKPNPGSNRNFRVRWIDDDIHREMTRRIREARIHGWDNLSARPS